MVDRLDSTFATAGDRQFIGRQRDIETILARVTRSTEEHGNMAVIGIPAIGKSSLINQAIIAQKRELLARRFLPIWINLGLFTDSKAFFRALVELSHEELEHLSWSTTSLEDAAGRVLQREFYSHIYIQRYFRILLEANIHVIFILDEFDHAKNLFQEAWDFHALHDLTNDPQQRVTFITLSFHSLAEIQWEKDKSSYSRLALIFQTHYLQPFNVSDLHEYFQYLTEAGISLTEELKERIDFYCGGHPLFLNMLSDALIDQLQKQQPLDVEAAAQKLYQTYIDYTAWITKLLQSQNSLKKLLQILFGPVVDVTSSDIDILLNYGLIRRNPSWIPDQTSAYIAFSGYFQSCLQRLAKQIDLWPLLTATERVLRKFISTQLQKYYGDHWLQELSQAQPDLLHQGNEHQQQENLLESNGARNPLDFLPLGLLLEIIIAYWDRFQPIFQTKQYRDKLYWAEQSQLITIVTAALTYSRDEVFSGSNIVEAEVLCETILEAVRIYEANEASSVLVGFRLVANVELTTASLEDSLTQLQQMKSSLQLALDIQRTGQLQKIMQIALMLCQQSSFEDIERLAISIETLCQELLGDIEEQPTQLSTEEILPIVTTLRCKTADHLANVYAISTPQVTLCLLKNKEFYLFNGRQIEVQLVVENKLGCSPAEAVRLVVQENMAFFTSTKQEFKLRQSLRGGERKYFVLTLQITEQVITSSVLPLFLTVSYQTRSGQQEHLGETFSLRFATDFAEIENPFFRYANDGVVDNPKMFYGRAELIKRIATAIRQAKPYSRAIMISGQKRSGKSSLLFHVSEELSQDPDLLVVNLNSIGRFTETHSSVKDLYKILWGILRRFYFALEDRDEAYSTLLPSSFPKRSEDFFQHANPLGLFTEVFEHFQRRKAKLENWHNVHVVLLIDEFSYLYNLHIEGRLSKDFMKQWKALLQDNFFSVILVSQDVTAQFKALFPNELSAIYEQRVSYLLHNDALRLMDEPIRSGGESRYTPNALERIFELTAGSPFYIQVFCNLLVMLANNKQTPLLTEIDVEDVKKSLLQGEYTLTWEDFDNLTNAGDNAPEAVSEEDTRKVLLAIALKSRTRPCSRDSIDCDTQSPLDKILQDLVTREVILAHGQFYSIRVGLFKEWLIAHAEGEVTYDIQS